MNGLDLFSGIGGITLALSPWVRPVAYCEIEPYARAVLLSRMSDNTLPTAPIWDDVRSLRGYMLPKVDIIYGGFPCQDISCAGRGKGLEGERSGLFFEIVRLVNEIQPKFIFLENVPAITTRGLGAVTAEITRLRYDCRWTTLSAAEVGAPHIRKRWWLLAYSTSERKHREKRDVCESARRSSPRQFRQPVISSQVLHPNTDSNGVWHESGWGEWKSGEAKAEPCHDGTSGWWSTEPNVGRVVNGLSFRMDRNKGLGNSVVPQCAREAFKKLAGIEALDIFNGEG